MSDVYDATVRDGGTAATVILPSFTLDSANNYGVSAVTAAELTLQAKYQLWQNANFFISRIGSSEPAPANFILSQFFTINNVFYDIMTSCVNDKDGKVAGPFRCETEISQVGNSSYLSTLDIYYEKTGEQLVQEKATYIFVNLTTRRPQAIPSDMRQIANAKNSTERFHWHREDFNWSQCDVASRKLYQKAVTEEHIDHNGHVNFQVYLRYAASCVEQRWDRVRAMSARFKRLSVLYEGEALSGDLLDFQVNTIKNQDQIYVHVFKQLQNKPLVKVKFSDFYSMNCDRVLDGSRL